MVDEARFTRFLSRSRQLTDRLELLVVELVRLPCCDAIHLALRCVTRPRSNTMKPTARLTARLGLPSLDRVQTVVRAEASAPASSSARRSSRCSSASTTSLLPPVPRNLPRARVGWSRRVAVSYTHLTLPTKRIV